MGYAARTDLQLQDVKMTRSVLRLVLTAAMVVVGWEDLVVSHKPGGGLSRI